MQGTTAHRTPNSVAKFFLFIAALFSIVMLFSAIKYQVAPVANDETAEALALAVPLYGGALLLLALGAAFPYERKWRAAFIVPLALFALSVGLAML